MRNIWNPNYQLRCFVADKHNYGSNQQTLKKIETNKMGWNLPITMTDVTTEKSNCNL